MLYRNKYFTAYVFSAIKALECFAAVGPRTPLGMFHLEVSERLGGCLAASQR